MVSFLNNTCQIIYFKILSVIGYIYLCYCVCSPIIAWFIEIDDRVGVTNNLIKNLIISASILYIILFFILFALGILEYKNKKILNYIDIKEKIKIETIFIFIGIIVPLIFCIYSIVE